MISPIVDYFNQNYDHLTKTKCGVPCANIGLTCWLSSLIQSLVHCSNLVDLIERNARDSIKYYSPQIATIVELVILCRFSTQDGTILCTLFNEWNGSQLGEDSPSLFKLEKLWTSHVLTSGIEFDIHEVFYHFLNAWQALEPQSLFNIFSIGVINEFKCQGQRRHQRHDIQQRELMLEVLWHRGGIQQSINQHLCENSLLCDCPFLHCQSTLSDTSKYFVDAPKNLIIHVKDQTYNPSRKCDSSDISIPSFVYGVRIVFSLESVC